MTIPTPQKPTPGPRIEIPEDIKPIYSNLARISHSPADIVVDFAQILPGENKAVIQSRILMTPLSAKLLMRAIQENLSRYEAAFGEINIPKNNNLAENLFKGIQPPEPPEE